VCHVWLFLPNSKTCVEVMCHLYNRRCDWLALLNCCCVAEPQLKVVPL
jgi:hypothetical protein